MNKKYAEIHVLKDRLREAGIPYEAQKAYDGWQVGIPHLYPEEDRISVIEHYSSSVVYLLSAILVPPFVGALFCCCETIVCLIIEFVNSFLLLCDFLLTG